MKKDVLIIEPRSASASVFSFFSYLPLLGPLYLGTTLKEAGYNVRFVTENILKKDFSDTDLDVDYLLLSCLTPTVQRGFEIAKRYKKLRPGGRVIMGGPHVSFLQDEAALYVDHVVTGEGENVIVDLLKYGSGDKVVKGERVKDLDSLPFIDWGIMDGFEKGNIMPLMTSRGCPFACNFCTVAEMFGRKYRAMSPERVLEEVKRSKKKHLFFYDDNFTADKKRAYEIMEGMKGLGIKKKTWLAQVRSDVTKEPELVKAMSEAGCDRVYIGFESIDPYTLKTLKKSQTPEDISRAINILHNYDIKIHGMFMYGSDSDDPNIVKATENFVKKSRIDSVQYMVLTPFPGTELYNRIESGGRLIHKEWKHYDGLHVVFWPEKFSPFDLQKLALASFKDFYSLTSAANEIVNLFAKKAGLAYSKGKVHTYSLKNALFKAGGKIIFNRWQKINSSYMSYLRQLSEGKAG